VTVPRASRSRSSGSAAVDAGDGAGQPARDGGVGDPDSHPATTISGNLPNAPVNDLVLAGRQLYVANDVGVFRSRSGGNQWERYGLRLPRTPMMELRVHEPSDRLYVGSFGRGIYSIETVGGAGRSTR